MADNTASIGCGDALTIANAANLHEQLQKAMANNSTIELDASAVEKVDTAGLQVIVAVSRELEKSGGNIVWKNPSEKVVHAVSTLGLSPFLAIN